MIQQKDAGEMIMKGMHVSDDAALIVATTIGVVPSGDAFAC